MIELVNIFFRLSWNDWAEIGVIIFSPLFGIGLIIGFIILPIICKFYIVPKIEKKIGKPLGCSVILNYLFLGKFLYRSGEISRYILFIYKEAKKYGRRGIPTGNWPYALKYSGYTIDMVSKSELIFAFCYKVNSCIMAASFFIALIASILLQYSEPNIATKPNNYKIMPLNYSNVKVSEINLKKPVMNNGMNLVKN